MNTITAHGAPEDYPGMSLRDYFAAHAMQGILSGPCSRENVGMSEWFDIPAVAYQLADAMLFARQPRTAKLAEPEVQS